MLRKTTPTKTKYKDLFPSAATLLAVGPRGVLPPYILYPPLSNRGIQFSSSHMVIRANSFFASANPSSRLLLDAAASARPIHRVLLDAAASAWPSRRFHRVAAAAPPGRCGPSTAGRRVAAVLTGSLQHHSHRRPLQSLQPRLRAATAAAGRRRPTPPAAAAASRHRL
jgi:hypothetical protein